MLLNRTFRVSDRAQRVWGTVLLRWLTPDDTLARSISGRLEPTEEFGQVRGLFERLDKLNDDDGSFETEEIEKLSAQISGLGVVITDTENGDRYDVGPVSVSPKLLFTCPMP